MVHFYVIFLYLYIFITKIISFYIHNKQTYIIHFDVAYIYLRVKFSAKFMIHQRKIV